MEEDNKCHICDYVYDSEPERTRKTLTCNHDLCRSCLLDLFKRDSKCPYCRREYVLLIKEKNVHENREMNNIASSRFSFPLFQFFATHIEIATNIIEMYNMHIFIGDRRYIVNSLSLTLSIFMLFILTMIIIFS